MKLSFLHNKIFSPRNHPIHNLGRLAVFCFLLAFITGIYLFIFYRIDPLEAYNSTEAISRQWLGGIMRSVHRYSSDLLVITVIWHFLQAILTGKFRKKSSWLTGLISFVIIIIIGLTGFILVWDQKAKLIGMLSAKLISAVPLFSPSLSGLFLIDDLKALSGFFRISFAAHFFLSLFSLFILYVHIKRTGNRKLLPSYFIMWSTTVLLLLMSVLFPVKSDLPANISILPVHSKFDWFYFAGFYPMKYLSEKELWVIILIITSILFMMPYLKANRATINANKSAGKKQVRQGLLISFIFVFCCIPFFSNSVVQFYSPDRKIVILNFKYVSSATETEYYQTDLKHMKYSSPIVKRRSAIEIQIISEQGDNLYSKIFEPSGLRKNTAVIVYDEIPVNHNIKIRLTEVSKPEIFSETALIDIRGAVVVLFQNGRLQLHHK